MSTILKNVVNNGLVGATVSVGGGGGGYVYTTNNTGAGGSGQVLTTRSNGTAYTNTWANPYDRDGRAAVANL